MSTEESDEDDEVDDGDEGVLLTPLVVLPSTLSPGFDKDTFHEGTRNIKFGDNDDDDDEVKSSPIKDTTAVATGASSSNRAQESASGAVGASSIAPWAKKLAFMAESS